MFGLAVQNEAGQRLALFCQIEKVKMKIETVFLSSKITEDSDYSHENKRTLFLGRKILW